MSTGRYPIEIHDLSKYPFDDIGRVVHLKGFASGLNYEDINTAEAAEHAVQFFKDIKAEIVVWDGDTYSDKSFTRLLIMLAESDRELQFIAFKKEDDHDKYNGGIPSMIESFGPYKKFLSRLTIFRVPETVNFAKLGQLALMVTGAKDVLCFGGGATVLSEFHAVNHPHETEGVTFWHINVKRTASESGWLQREISITRRPPLCKFPDPEGSCASYLE